METAQPTRMLVVKGTLASHGSKMRPSLWTALVKKFQSGKIEINSQIGHWLPSVNSEHLLFQPSSG